MLYPSLEKPTNRRNHSSIHPPFFYLQFAQTIGVDDRTFLFFLKTHTQMQTLLVALLNHDSSFQTVWPNRRCPLSLKVAISQIKTDLLVN